MTSRSGGRRERVSRVVVTGEGPILVEGPVDVVMDNGTVVRSARSLVALCTCRRSRIAPFCDTSHRCKVRAERVDRAGPLTSAGEEA
ncbi:MULTISPECIES: CDGSH iron-sulfur domain-containing protein [unclassified Knoellia]|uniref:CDGSH iron-sulfur domain-containing protein n=1 Tax=Knoellia altitudinis TaxID=3404795 RepID=UPI00361A5C48